jgi:hypothetical protein
MEKGKLLVLFEIQLGKEHAPTGKTLHTLGGQPLPAAVSLQIVQLGGADGYYLFYLDGSGKELTDTWHETIDRAMKQAEREYGVKKSDWLARAPTSGV